jgi:hypothetical protein
MDQLLFSQCNSEAYSGCILSSVQPASMKQEKKIPRTKPPEAKSVIPCVDISIGFKEHSLPPLNRMCLQDILSDQCHLLTQLTLTYEKEYNTSYYVSIPGKT